MHKYSVLMYNFNNYEIMREPIEVDPDCEYIYVTDNPTLKNDTNVWKVVVDSDLDGLSVFDKCYRVRFNLFKYATCPTCIYVDGSIQIYKSLRKLYEDFIKSNCDLGVMVHPECDNVYDEYHRWLQLRNYPYTNLQKALCMFKAAGWNPKEKGLYQGCLRICRNTELNNSIDSCTLNTLIELGTENTIERLDQTIYTFIIHSLFNDVNIFGVSQQVIQSNYMKWCKHNSTISLPYCNGNDKLNGFILGKEQLLYRL